MYFFIIFSRFNLTQRCVRFATLALPLSLGACTGSKEDNTTTYAPIGSGQNDGDSKSDSNNNSDTNSPSESNQGENSDAGSGEEESSVENGEESDSENQEESGGEDSSGPAGGSYQIRFVHLAVGLSSLDLYVNETSEPTISELSFGSTSDYRSLAADDFLFQFVLSGDSSDEVILESGPHTFGSNPNHTLTLIGTTSDDSLDLFKLEDPTPAMDSENLRFEVVHAAPDFEEFDFIDAENETEYLSDVPYRSTGTIFLPPAVHKFGLDFDNDGQADAVFLADFSLESPGSVIHLFVSNDAQSSPELTLVALNTDSEVRTFDPDE